MRLMVAAWVVVSVVYWGVAAAAGIDDAAALKGVSQGKGLFLLSSDNPRRLAGTLAVIEKTHEGLRQQGAEPDLKLVFLGGAVAYLTRDRKGLPFDELALVEGIHQRLAQLQKQGLTLEVCNIALQGRGVAPADVVAPVTVVGNGFISAIGYQRRGYALVPVP